MPLFFYASQMEICQTGYYTEDFRTQEVPAGFDFASYGEFKESLDFIMLLHHKWNNQDLCPGDITLSDEQLRQITFFFFMFVRSVSSEPEQLKDRGNILTDSIITSVRVYSVRP